MDPKTVQQFPKGSMEMALLCLIAQGETYGYEILMKLNESAQVLGYAREGTIYPIPYRLEEARLIASGRTPARTKWESNDLFAHAAGQEALAEMKSFWRRYVACVDGYIAQQERGEKKEREYLREVRRELYLPRGKSNFQRRRARRGRETTDCPAGPASARTREMEVQLGVDGAEIGLRTQKTAALLAALCGLVCAALAAVMGKSAVPAGAIGGAEAMTGLWVSGPGIDLRAALVFTGALAIKIHVGRKK